MLSLQERGYKAQGLTRAVAELEPDLVVNDGVETISYYPDEGYLMVRPAIGALLALGIDASAWSLRIGAEVAGFETRGEGGSGVRLASGELIEADTVVTCVGRAPPRTWCAWRRSSCR